MVPVKVDALFQASDELAIGPDIAFDALPYFDKELGLDINPDSPYLAESVVSQPFKNSNFVLKKGIHLKWRLPDFLQSSHLFTSQKNTAEDQAISAMTFPPVPTRWLISRFIGDASTPDNQWVIESDTLFSDLKGARLYGHAQTSIDVKIDEGERPYTYMGRVSTLAEWVKRKGELESGFTTWKNTHQGHALTAAGWGSPAFDVFYPNSNGVFSFHDPEITSANNDKLSYSIIGWYGEPDDDYWTTFVNSIDHQDHHQGIDELDHLESKQKVTFKRQHIEKILADKLGVKFAESVVEDALDLPNKGMICYAKVTPNKVKNIGEINAHKFKVSVGNTPTEALSAMIVGEIFADLEQGEREKKEDQFEAILLGDRLKSLKMDIGAKFREIRHQGEFSAVDGGINWSIELVDDNPHKELHGDPHLKINRPILPFETGGYLEKLNTAQTAYDQALDELESAKAAVYADWCRYMQCAYPPPGETFDYLDTSKIITMMRQGSLKRYRAAMSRRGLELGFDNGYPMATSKTYTSGYGQAVIDAYTDIHNYLKGVVNASVPDKARVHWEVHPSPAPRFWEPVPPAVVLALPTNTIHIEEQPSRLQLTKCHVYSKQINLNADAHDFEGVLKWLKETCEDENDLGNSVIIEKSRSIFRSEWEAEIFPLAAMHQRDELAGQYNADFVLNNFFLGENEPDLDYLTRTGGNALKKTANIYTGSCHANLRLKQRYLDLLNAFKKLQGEDKRFNVDIKLAEDFLKKHQLISIPLSSFNSALLQMHESIQLHPADPLGFEDDMQFAKEVGAILSAGKGFSPDPQSAFMPIRAGGLRLLNLRLIDHFGRKIEVTPQTVHTTTSMQIADHKDWLRLTPRLAQAARFNLRFLQADSRSLKESHSHLDSTPLCGWVTPELLGKRLFFYHADGKLHGEIDQNGKWNGPPLNNTSANRTLIAIINWVIENAAKKSEFLSDLLEDIEEAMDNIHPSDREDKGVFSLLMGRPMALVNINVELQLKGDRAFNLNWSNFAADMHRSERETDNYEHVQFPFRLGEYIQRNDGLVGFWQLSSRTKTADSFQINDSISASIEIPDNHLQFIPDWLAHRNQEWAITRGGQTLMDYLLSQENNMVKKQDLIRGYTREGSKVWQHLVELDWLRPEKQINVGNNNVIRHYSESETSSVSVADKAKEFACLMDPYGKLHLSSGIQPVKAIQLPERFVSQALKNIEVSFLSAPVLGPENAAVVSLPKEQGYGWNWVENNAWPISIKNLQSSESTVQHTVISEQDLQGFKTNAHFAERFVIREGWLQLKPADTEPKT